MIYITGEEEVFDLLLPWLNLLLLLFLFLFCLLISLVVPRTIQNGRALVIGYNQEPSRFSFFIHK